MKHPLPSFLIEVKRNLYIFYVKQKQVVIKTLVKKEYLSKNNT